MNNSNIRQAIARAQYDAVLFDLDGVITDTSNLHAACWKRMFDEYLKKRAAQSGEEFRPFELSTPIRLTHSPSRCSVIPVAGIKLGIGRRLCVASDAEQRTEGVERVEAPVEPKREFVEVGL